MGNYDRYSREQVQDGSKEQRSSDGIVEASRLGAAAVGLNIETVKIGDFEFPVGARVNDKGGVEFLSFYAEAQRWGLAPDCREGSAKINTLDSFIDLVNYHKGETTSVFANIDGAEPEAEAVIDYHAGGLDDGKPGFMRHRISYAFPLSEEWKAWAGHDGKSLTQDDFAEFIEDHVADLGDSADAAEDAKISEMAKNAGLKFGAPSDIITVSRGLKLTVTSGVKQVVSLPNGAISIRYDETHATEDGKPLEVPSLFIVSIPMFMGGKPVRMYARLRYRHRQGQGIFWSFHLWDVKRIRREALKADLGRIATDTALPVYEGSPEA